MRKWELTIGLVCAALVLLAGCGATGDATSDATGGATAAADTTASPAASAAASGAPAPDIVQKAPVQHVKVGDLDVGYRTIGPIGAAADSTPLLMIMGSSGTMDEWSPQFVEALAQGREVVVFDNRGMGETNDPGGAYQFSQLADDTAGLIKALGFDKMDVLGWSMGGDVALDLAVRHPQVVNRLVSYAGDAGGPHAVPMSKQTLAVLTDTSGTAEQRGMRLLTLLFPEAYRKADPAYAESFPHPDRAGLARGDRAAGQGDRRVEGRLERSQGHHGADAVRHRRRGRDHAGAERDADGEGRAGRRAGGRPRRRPRPDVPGPAEARRRGDGLPRPVSRAVYSL